MSETKKPRVMTEKGFLHKATGKVSASAFLAQHRAWLETGDLAIVTKPVLLTLDEVKQTLLTAKQDTEGAAKIALDTITKVVLDHMIAKAANKAEEAILNPKEKTPKNWVATIYNAKGEIQTRVKDNGEIADLQEGFDKSSDADRWTDRRLFDGASDWFGVVASTTMLKIETIVLRDDAIARILKKPAGMVCKSKPQSTPRLGFGVKAKGDHFHFSKG